MNLTANWTLTQTAPDACVGPADLTAESTQWIPAIVPGTVAQSFLAVDRWTINDLYNFDANDFWYKSQFSYDGVKNQQSVFLSFEGLATLCTVWLNGERILDSDNMFVRHRIDVASLLENTNELYLCFRSLTQSLTHKRPRPRWKTKVVEQQQLRWIRTTLLGRIPGWTPPVAAVGPWKTISMDDGAEPANVTIYSQLQNTQGVVSFSCDFILTNKNSITARLIIGDKSNELKVVQSGNEVHLAGELTISNPTLWWPHTHGQSYLYDVSLEIITGESTSTINLTPIGFKTVELDTLAGNFSISINGKPIFCRGACWTINDIVSLSGDNSELEQTLNLMQSAGANMIRVGGTMVYEQDQFYRLCDKLGIMVWQDFMFANMDYPIEDEAFLANVKIESEQQLVRLSKHTSLAMYCGNSEIEQQTAMLGVDRVLWSNSLFSKLLPEWCGKLHPGIPYVSSTPTGGVLPFHTNAGLSHYYGVGAYLASVNEVRSHDVKFTSECLGFANIPVSRTRNSVLNGQLPVTHHPKWKERTPRDTATGWDFEDVRDHYFKKIYSIEPDRLRKFDPGRYITLSEVVTGEIMAQVFSEWRSSYSSCNGGLVWFLKDFWAGAGWGIIDSNNQPKACYYALKRVWQPVSVHLSNESLNGVHVHIVNENEEAFSGALTLTLLNQDGVKITEASIPVEVKGNSKIIFQSDEMLDGFYDCTYSYRFGGLNHSVISATLVNDNKRHVSDSFLFPEPWPLARNKNIDVEISLKLISDDEYQLIIKSNHFLFAVNIDAPGFLPSDNFFHYFTGQEKCITLIKNNENIKRCKGYISAINMDKDVKFK